MRGKLKHSKHYDTVGFLYRQRSRLRKSKFLILIEEEQNGDWSVSVEDEHARVATAFSGNAFNAIRECILKLDALEEFKAEEVEFPEDWKTREPISAIPPEKG